MLKTKHLATHSYLLRPRPQFLTLINVRLMCVLGNPARGQGRWHLPKFPDRTAKGLQAHGSDVLNCRLNLKKKQRSLLCGELPEDLFGWVEQTRWCLWPELWSNVSKTERDRKPLTSVYEEAKRPSWMSLLGPHGEMTLEETQSLFLCIN